MRYGYSGWGSYAVTWIVNFVAQWLVDLLTPLPLFNNSLVYLLVLESQYYTLHSKHLVQSTTEEVTWTLCKWGDSCLHMCLCIRLYPPHSPDSQHELVCSSSQKLTHSQSNVLIRDCMVHTEVIAMTRDVDPDTHSHTCPHTHLQKRFLFF